MKKQDDKTVEIRIRLWTNKLPRVESPKLVWEHGMAYVIANPTLGIKSCGTHPFKNTDDLKRVVEKIATMSDIALVRYGKNARKRRTNIS